MEIVGEIEKGIPIPERGSRFRKWGCLYKMQPGDSFFLSTREKRTVNAIQSLCTHLKKRNGMSFSFRKRDENGTAGYRIWRIE